MSSGATVANAFVQVMPSMEGAGTSIADAIVPQLSGAGDKAGSQFGTLFAGKAGVAMKALGGALAGVLSVKVMKDAFKEVNDGFNNVVLATGATGEAAASLKATYLDVSKNVVGSFGDIGSAVGEINTRLGLEGDELESVTEQMMKYAKVTGQDATAATKDIASMMRNTGIPTEELAGTLDKLTVAGQAAGVDVSSLAQNVTKYNAVMKTMGFTTDEQIAIMSKFEQSGADTTSILNAMKKGVASWAKDGKDAKTEFEKFVKGVEDGSVTAGDAVEIFGSKGGLSMYEAAKKGQLSFGDMYDTITGASEGALDSVYNSTLTLEEKLGVMGKKIQAGFYSALDPIVTALMPTVDSALDAFGSAIESASDAVTPAMTEISAAIQPLMDEILPALQETFGEVMADVGAIVEEVWPTISDTIKAAVQIVLSVMRSAWPAISAIVTTAMTAIRQVVSVVWPFVSNIIKTAVASIKTIINGLRPILGVVKTIFNGVKSAIKDPIDTAKNAVKGAIDKIKSIINGAKLSLPHFKLPHFKIDGGQLPWGIGGKGKKPSIGVEWYAKGGIVEDATLIGAGERGTEFVWPKYNPYMSEYAAAIAEHLDSGGVNVTLNYTGSSDPSELVNELSRGLRQLKATGAI